MSQRPTTKHDIQRDELNTTRPTFADITNLIVSGSMTMSYQGIDLGTGQVILFAGYDNPGGRLTLSSGNPVPSVNTTGTRVYYTNYINNSIMLWNSGTSNWDTYLFAEPFLDIGSMTSGTGQDVFAYPSGTTVVLEKTAWTNSSSRATGVSYQDGRLCKTGDKTRRLVGSFMPSSTTLTEDSTGKRFLWNMYNRRERNVVKENGTSHNYNSATVRPFNNDAANSQIEFFVGLIEDAVNLYLTGQGSRVATDGNPRISMSTINSLITENSAYGWAIGNGLAGRVRGGSSASDLLPLLGYNAVCMLEASSSGTPPGASIADR